MIVIYVLFHGEIMRQLEEKERQLTVRIAVYADADYYVEVNDDGRGIDINALKNDENPIQE